MKKEEFLAMKLPYGCKCIYSPFDEPYSIVEFGPSRYNMFVNKEYDYKPILRPLSELEQILLFEFEKYHQNIDCNNEIIELFCEEHIKTSDLVSEINIESLPFDTVIWMIKNHFDIAGFIEKGEAIDVNTLQENPYK